MPSQEEYVEDLRRFREQQRKEYNEEYRKKYMPDIQVGAYVNVRCDGPGPCKGILEEIADDGITVFTCDSVRPEHVFIEYGYLRDHVVVADRYLDKVMVAMQKWSRKCRTGDIVTVSTMSCSRVGVFIGFTHDSIILGGNKQRAVPIVIVNDIDVSPNEVATKWCRKNAPEAAHDLTDDELWQLMGHEYLDVLRKADSATHE